VITQCATAHKAVERASDDMITGLQITIRGEELSRSLAERIRVHEATISALDVRISRRQGDQPFDIRPDDGFKTLGELVNEREHYRGRVLQLTLLRDNLVPGEVYALSRTDLRLAELIAPDCADASEPSEDRAFDAGQKPAIDGLKVTVPGAELRRLLKQRLDDHRRRADWWKAEEARTPEEQTEDSPLLPDHMCANEAERHEWRADVLGFIRDHIEPAEVYRLGEADLAFGELLPEKPEWMEQEEYEERNRVGFQVERLTKRIGELMPGTFTIATTPAEHDESVGS
jgi:hypothetical protein